MDEPGKATGTQIAFRCSTELRDALQESADKADRTLAAECLRRLRRSFDAQALVEDALAIRLGFKGAVKDEVAVQIFSDLYGPEEAKLGSSLAFYLYVLRHSKSRGNRLVIQRSELDALKAAVRELEQGVELTDNRDHQALPVSAQQVREAMMMRIANGQWKPNTAIPKESELAREFGVSAETVREALDIMEGERLLTRRAAAASPLRGAPRSHIFLVASSPPSALSS
jgi:hypothetical protein